jgi:hypothetical protein
VIEPADDGGSVTIIHPYYDGDTPGRPNGQIVSATADDIPIPDDPAPDTGSSSGISSYIGFGFSRISGTASIPGFTSGGGGGSGGSSGGGSGGSSGGGSGGSSGGGNSGGGPSVNPGGGGVV